MIYSYDPSVHSFFQPPFCNWLVLALQAWRRSSWTRVLRNWWSLNAARFLVVTTCLPTSRCFFSNLSLLPNLKATPSSEGLTINGHHGEAARMPRAMSLTELVYQPDSFNSPESVWNPKQPLSPPPQPQAACLPPWPCLNRTRVSCVWTQRPVTFLQCGR
jgi:hypothetical protein